MYNLSSKIPVLLLNLFFLIPTFSVLGPFFPDLFITITVLYVLFVSIYEKDQIVFNYIKKNNFVIFFLIFSVYLFINSVINFIDNNNFSYNATVSFFSRTLFLFRFIIYPVSLIYLIKKFNLRFEKKYAFYLILTILFIIVDLIIQYNFGKDIFGFTAQERGVAALNRLSGPFGDELIPGSFLMRYFFISLFFLTLLISVKYLNISFVSLMIFMLAAILITGERSAFLLASFGVFISFIIFKYLRLKILFASIIFLFLGILVLLSNSSLKSRVVDHTLFQIGISNKWGDNSYMKSLGIVDAKFIDSPYGALWETGFRIWNDNKFFGVGVKQFRVKCAQKKYDNNKSILKSIRCATHPHNTYMEVLSETGSIGFLLFALLIILLFKKIFMIKKYEKSIKLPLISTILIFWPIIPTGSFFTNATQIYFSFLLTVIFMIETNFFGQGKKNIYD